jgi:hypothetical protein
MDGDLEGGRKLGDRTPQQLARAGPDNIKRYLQCDY